MDKDFRKAIHEADRYVRKKNYNCLFPGCKVSAIRGHAIQRALILEALAVDGVIYSLQQSFTGIFSMGHPLAPLQVVKTGVNDASVFKGYCSEHDRALFAPAEVKKGKIRRSKHYSLHLRAVTLEYARKRRTAEFNLKFSELISHPSLRREAKEEGELYKNTCDFLMGTYLSQFFFFDPEDDSHGLEWYCIPFKKNLNVSCSGIWYAKKGVRDSLIGYNLISYSDMSFLVLTAFKFGKQHLYDFIDSYKEIDGTERLINDIAFSCCEEPLISPRIWDFLNETERLEIRLSLRPPELRDGEPVPRVIKIMPNDCFDSVTPELYARLFQ